MRAWHLSYPLVWAVVFIRYKAMREAYQWIRTVSSHTLLFIIKSRTEGTGRLKGYIDMWFWLIVIAVVIGGIIGALTSDKDDEKSGCLGGALMGGMGCGYILLQIFFRIFL